MNETTEPRGPAGLDEPPASHIDDVPDELTRAAAAVLAVALALELERPPEEEG